MQAITTLEIQILNITINTFVAGLATVAFFMELRSLISNTFLFPAKPPQSSHQCYLSHEECDRKVTFIPISWIPKPGKQPAHRTRTGKRYTIILKYPLALSNDNSVLTYTFHSLWLHF